jgi:uncharacterized protein (DUF697 family)
MPRQKAILDRLETAWAVPARKKGLVGRVLEEARATVWPLRVEPAADRARRQAQVDAEVIRSAVLAAALALHQKPLVSIATDLTVVSLQARMFRDVGELWDRAASVDSARHVIAGFGVGSRARVAVSGFVKFVPGAGSVFAASTNFACTWALGRVAGPYWESGGRALLDMPGFAALRALFESSKLEGRRLYLDRAAEVEAKYAAIVGPIDELSAEYEAGRITLADYERRVVALK